MSVLQSAPTYRYFTSDTCRFCSVPIKSGIYTGSNPRWLFSSSSRTKQGTEIVSLVQGCESCSDMDIALRDAKCNANRFTLISTFNHECDWGSRCACGSAALVKHNKCVTCSRAYRMLDKLQSQSRIVANLLNDLRRQSKQLLKDGSNGRQSADYLR